LFKGIRTNVLSVKGKKQAARLPSAETGSLKTTVICRSASEVLLPPLIVFPRARPKAELNGIPPGRAAARHYSGWIRTLSLSGSDSLPAGH
jgi:hypothetical protein